MKHIQYFHIYNVMRSVKNDDVKKVFSQSRCQNQFHARVLRLKNIYFHIDYLHLFKRVFADHNQFNHPCFHCQ